MFDSCTILPEVEGGRMVEREQEDSMSKKNSLFETVITTLGNLAKSNPAQEDASLALAQVHFVEELLKKASLSTTERVRADAALYQALRSFTLRPNVISAGPTTEGGELPVVGESPADKKLQVVIQRLGSLRAKREESIVEQV